jgi:outer membrane protein OmpA-like peptidoglycan-associated protein/tetratricopeptide (TPR) repeat protein
MKNVLLPIIFLILSNISFGQNEKQAKKSKAAADNAFYNDDYKEALANYRTLDSLIPHDKVTLLQISFCELKLGNYEEAHHALNQSDEYEDVYLDEYFIHGRIYHLNNDFAKGKESYQQFAALLDSAGIKDEELTNELKRYIEQCENGIYHKKNPLVIEVHDLDGHINTEYPEYAPVVSADESVIFFTSRRPSTKGGKTDRSKAYYEDIYMSTREDDHWSEPHNIDALNTEKHDASVSISPDGETLLLYRPKKGLIVSGDLYISHHKEKDSTGEWTTPELLDKSINSKYWEPSGCISADNKHLYFVSDRPGGFGGTDLYLSELREDGTWGPAKNLGKEINTEYDEDSPFISIEGDILYFSSKGHDGMGGYDVFFAEIDEYGEWGNTKNIGYPINTAKDELYFSWNQANTKGYFSTAHKDTHGDQDIYAIIRPGAEKIYIKGYITNIETGDSLSHIQIEVRNPVNPELSVTIFSDSLGLFKVPVSMGQEYTLHLENEKYDIVDDTLNIPSKKYYFEYEENIALHPRKIIIDTVTDTTEPVFALLLKDSTNIDDLKIYFGFNKTHVKSSSHPLLDELAILLVADSTITLEIIGHTDNVGSEKVNNRVSLKRAKSVRYYLTKQGVPKAQLIVSGQGESNPITTNDTKEGRQENRRTEFKASSK